MGGMEGEVLCPGSFQVPLCSWMQW